MSSIGASIGSNRSMTAPAATSAANSVAASPPSDSNQAPHRVHFLHDRSPSGTSGSGARAWTLISGSE